MGFDAKHHLLKFFLPFIYKIYNLYKILIEDV